MGHYLADMYPNGRDFPKVEPTGYELERRLIALQRRVTALERTVKKPRSKKRTASK